MQKCEFKFIDHHGVYFLAEFVAMLLRILLHMIGVQDVERKW